MYPEPGYYTSRGGCSRKASGYEAVLWYSEWPATQRMRPDRLARRVKIFQNRSSFAPEKFVKSPSEPWLAGIRGYVMSVFQCGPNSIHGPMHWQRVEAFGLRIAESSGADLTVVRLFALLHDSCRLNDGYDFDHGTRAAELLDRIVPTVFALDRDRLALLKQAIRLHTSGQTTEDPTIGTCWDADRLEHREGRHHPQRPLHEHRRRERNSCTQASACMTSSRSASSLKIFCLTFNLFG